MATKKPPNKSELELRRWCIEQAVKWPWQAYTYNSGYAGAGIPPQYRAPEQPDIVKRATEIYNWVNNG